MGYDPTGERTTNRGTNNGYAPLGAAATVPLANLPALGASGTGHSAGYAPDPGAVAGTSRFLREDATWKGLPYNSFYSASLTGQTGSVADTVISTGGGWFDVYIEVTVTAHTGSGATLSVHLEWSDPDAAFVKDHAVPGATNGLSEWSYMVYLQTDLTYRVDYSATTGNSTTYSIRVVVLQRSEA